MNYTHYFGVDISKCKLDICVFNGKDVLSHHICENNLNSIQKLFKSLGGELMLDEALVCAEHTGLYSYSLVEACKKIDLDLCLENPSEIKMSSGVTRGKNDKIDAERIARYAHRYSDKIRLYKSDNETIEALKVLASERELYVVDRAKYKAQIKSQKGHLPSSYYKAKSKRLRQIIAVLDEQVSLIEDQIDNLIKDNEVLCNQEELITSIDGIGKQVALHTIIETSGFTRINNPRKFACHAGVAPFAYLSGSSQRTKWKVSNKANKNLKRLFHMAALSAIQKEGELRDYYLRKVEEGKNKMTVINAVRAKLIHRIFAVIKNNRKYDQNYVNSLALSIR